MLTKKVPIFYLLLFALLGSGATFLVLHGKENRSAIPQSTSDTAGKDDVVIKRVHSYKFINPIISVDHENEFEGFAPLKSEISEIIASEKKNGLATASVYFKDLNKADWIVINPDEKYDPGSLLKVGVLMTYLRMADANPNLLGSEMIFHKESGFRYPSEHYRSDTVQDGKKYTVNELLQFMIRYSDNYATVFLENYMDTTVFKKEFIDLGVTEPRFDDPNYVLNVKEYSGIFNALYNAGYLKKKASEDALALLSQSTFKDGLLKELPGSLLVAHKFGEAGKGNLHELHECGIFYLAGRPYLLTIMTKGTEWNNLSEVIGRISKVVYGKMSIDQKS